MMPLPLFALAGCLAVNPASDRIVASDFVPAFAEMEQARPDALVALAPAPGVERVFRVPELQRLAARFQLAAAPTADICFARRVAPLAPERLLEAMRKTLPGARIEIVESSRQPAPDGELEFPLGGLRGRMAGGPPSVLWTGWVRYAGNRRFPVWARVEVSVRVARVLASADLHPGVPIDAANLQAVEREEAPASEAFAASIDDVVGKCPRVPIRAGTPILIRQLGPARDVLRGDKVEVEVRNGGASLKLEGIAEASGSVGDTIPVRNPDSQKRFRARVEARGQVSIDAAPGNSARKIMP
jgi:flagella basal body P-ring formation protein FlgA